MNNEQKISFTKNHEMEQIALIMALHCVRNTVIEDYHVFGKITDIEMKIFNKEVANKIYSFLELLTNPELKEIKEFAINNSQLFYKPASWDVPEFDNDFKKGLERLKITYEQDK